MNKQDIITAIKAARKELLAQGLGGDETAMLLRCIKSLKCDIEREREADTKYPKLIQVGKSAYSSIADMVAALNCDYDRLDALKDQRTDDVTSSPDFTIENREKLNAVWALNNPDDAKELGELESQAGDCTSREDAEQRIQEDALEVTVRSDFYNPHDNLPTPSEFCILLSTGGPASRIVGELNQYSEPVSARLEVQNWFQLWTVYNGDEVSESVLLDYCRCFYFGEG